MGDNVIQFRSGRADRRQLPEEVASFVRELIMSGQVRPGDFLRMEPIAAAVGVSNTPVREGLLALRSEGFVDLVPRRGFVVAPISRQDVHDLFWAQAQFAAELAARAATTITPAQIDELEAVNARLDAAIRIQDLDSVAALGHEFHRQINLAAASHRLTRLLGSVVKHLPNRFYASLEGQVAATRDDHLSLLRALRERDAQQARAITEKHIFEGAREVFELLDQVGNTETGPEK